MPKLTIAIPTYNRAQWLEKCLSALGASLRQSQARVTDLEIFVSDNASTDESAKVVERAKATIPGLQYHKLEQNVGANRNVAHCVRLAKGEYVWCIGDDDFVKPDAIDRLLEILDGSLDYAIINFQSIYAKNDVVESARRFPTNTDIYFSDPDSAMRYFHEFPGFISCVIARKEILGCLTQDEEDKFVACHFNQLYAFYKGIPGFYYIGIIIALILI